MAHVAGGMDQPSRKPSLRGRNGNGQFAPGNGGGPGRPHGYRSQIAQALDDSVSEDDLRAIVDKAVILAKEGDPSATKLVLDRYWPAPKCRLVHFDLPAIESAGDVPKAFIALLAAVASGNLTLDEANQFAGIIEQLRRAYELAEIEKRVVSLEEGDLVPPRRVD